MGFIDLNQFSVRSSRKSNGSSLVFVKAKTTQGGQSVIARLHGDPWEYESFYCKASGRSRAPREDERGTRRFLWGGWDHEGTQRVFDLGVTVVDGIRKVYDILGSRDVWVEITSTGSGTSTEYCVGRAKRKDLPTIDPATYVAPDFDGIVRAIAPPEAGAAAAAAVPTGPVNRHDGDVLHPEDLIPSPDSTKAVLEQAVAAAGAKKQ
jgi:hypothetical protein